MDMMGQEEESVIEHEGKKYTRIQITGLGDDEVYLMDEVGGIYSLDFKYNLECSIFCISQFGFSFNCINYTNNVDN